MAACRAFRRWALSHKDEFALLFGVPLPGLDDGGSTSPRSARWSSRGPSTCCSSSCGTRPASRCPAHAEIDPGLRAQLGRFGEKLGTDAPDGAILVFLRCWVLLYGAVSMEVFGHLGFALDDPAPMFELTLGDLAGLVGLEYPLPAA